MSLLRSTTSCRDHSSRARFLAITGTALQLGPLLGLLGTAFTPDPVLPTQGAQAVNDFSALLAAFNHSRMIAMTIALSGLVAGTVGLVLLLVAVMAYRYRGQWLFWFLVIYGASLLRALPVGTLIGATILAYWLAHRNEFLSPSPGSGDHS